MDQIFKIRKPAIGWFSRNFSGTQVVVGIRRVRIVDVHLAIKVVPVDVRDIAIGIARAAYLPNFIHVTDNLLIKLSVLADSLSEVFWKRRTIALSLKLGKQFLKLSGKPLSATVVGTDCISLDLIYQNLK